MNLYQQPEKHLVQFNAGKCIRDGNKLKPDLRKGMIYMDQGDDQLMHFYWKERKSANGPEDDFIIFPDEAELLPVPECTTGRVIVLKYKTSSQRLFYWMQKLDNGMDDLVIRHVNQLIDDPSSAMGGSQMDVDSVDSSDPNMEMDLMQRLMGSSGQGNLTEENLLELFQQADPLSHTNNSGTNDDDENNETDINTTNATVPSTTGTVATTTTTASNATDVQSSPEQQQLLQHNDGEAQSNLSTNDTINPEQFGQLQSMLAGMQQYQGDRSDLQLGDVLTNQTLSNLLNDTQVCHSLYPCLPDQSEQTPDEVRQVAKSPQFQQAIHSLSAALRSGQLGPLLTQLGLDASAGNGVESFLNAIEDQARKKDNDKDTNSMDEN